jgi:hypothetical protein
MASVEVVLRPPGQGMKLQTAAILLGRLHSPE